jgi:hypothetical protein
MPPRKQPLQ